MPTTSTVTGTYGSGNTKADIFIYEYSNGAKWYCVYGSVNVNKTYDAITEGTNVEELNDYDIFTANKSITSEDELSEAVES